MDITGDDSDPGTISKPNFNSTVLGPDERPPVPESPERKDIVGQHRALELSPIPHHQLQSMDTSSTGENSQFESLHGKLKGWMSSSRTAPKSELLETDKGIEETTGGSGFGALTDAPPQLTDNSTTRSHITNPFDSDLMESLRSTTYSPSLFEKSKKNDEEESGEESFRWSIGQMADFHPVDIDESEAMYRTPERDPAEEAQLHSAIDRFWASQKYIMPSPQLKGSAKTDPMGSPSSAIKRRAAYQESPLARSPYRNHSNQRTVEVQTMFTFPPNLDLVGLLGNFFQYEEGEVAVFEANLSLETLRRKLFNDISSSQTTAENMGDNDDDGNDPVPMAVDDDDHPDDDREPFGDERPPWYHSDDEVVPIRRISFDDITDPDNEAEISSRLLSPDVSPIKK